MFLFIRQRNMREHNSSEKENSIFVFMYLKQVIVKIVLFFAFCISFALKAQISHGGRPLPYLTMKSVPTNIFQEMPAFDIDAEKRIDSLEQNDFRGGFRFAYKFMTDFSPGNSGYSFTLADGTKVWRLGIRSAEAYSINLLFSEFELPVGAKLFLYTPDQSQVLGAFNHLNNSEYGLLPVAPIQGPEVIIEYQEPPGVDFPGRLKVGEVNHAYRDFRGLEPDDTRPAFACMPPVVCWTDTTDRYDEIARSVVLLVIDGTTMCSGTLINNTSNDKTPYLLTASHCLNKQFTISNPDYIKIASTIVSFFNYESPFCTPILRGTEELSMASARLYAVNEFTDMALLGLMDIPPVYYQPYYAGWNITETPAGPYKNIHHPWGSVKRINNSTTTNLELQSYTSMPLFNKNSFWHIDTWERGSTAGGSSGSPLLDSENRIIGALTGGKSTCDNPQDDLFYALHKSWTAGNSNENNLQPWLDPSGSGLSTCLGLDPYGADKAIKLSNVQTSGNRELAEVTLLPQPESGQQFGVNSLQTTEYAESYTIAGYAALYGAYFVTPPIRNNTNLTVEVTIYNTSGNNTPGEVLYTTDFKPTYTNKLTQSDDFQETTKPLNRAQESFVKFETPVAVSDRFFIGYKITAFEKDSFAVYNLPGHATSQNTAWFKAENEWKENTAHPLNPFKSSLFINPVFQRSDPPTANEETIIPEIKVHADREEKKITIQLPAELTRVRYALFSVDGKIIQNGIFSEERNHLYLQQKGAFILALYSGNKKQVTKVVL